MNTVADLPPEIQARIAGRDIIVFDGECVLCSGFFKSVVHADKGRRFHFVIAQSELGAAIYGAMGLPVRAFETNLVIVDGRIYQRLDAFGAAMRALGWPWRVSALCMLIPEPLKSWMYHRIARNRYSIFGRYDTCMIPDAALRARFVTGGMA